MNEIKKHIAIFFKGFAQIMLQENPFTGLLFLIAIAYDSGTMALAGAVANIVSIATAKLCRFEQSDIDKGLFGFNSSLAAIALVFYFQVNFWIWLTLIITAICTTLMMGWAIKKRIPVYTFPFVLATCIALFVLSIPELAVRTVPEHFVDIQELDDFWVQGHAFGQVIFQGSVIAGMIFFIGVFISSPIAALYGFISILISVSISHHGHEPTEQITAGVFSFNAVLCGIACSGPKPKNGFYVLLTVLIATYFDMLLIDNGWATLTFPFVFAMWILNPLKKYIFDPLEGRLSSIRFFNSK
ncbi:urea transporter [Flavobacterium sp. '19STA2R22 D10 B1']|uniref:urea transporter n=1 Tax=Flavobacterium aerium TaxID=3037261 RepID=UPI00278BD4E6|nr:urea transporter [Flavobacterium sp. '19STA2R22 D10 B1']